MSTVLAFVMPGGAELVIIFVVLLLLFGAKKLPELARGIGRSLGEFKKAKEEFEHEIRYSEQEIDREDAHRLEDERRRKFEESKKAKKDAESDSSDDSDDSGDAQDSADNDSDDDDSKKAEKVAQSQASGAADSDLSDD